MEFAPYDYHKKHLEGLKELCPINTFKVVDPAQLLVHGLPRDLIDKSVKAVVCGSGDTLGITTVYMINFIRPDEKVLAVDQEPFIVSCYNNIDLTAGFIHHGDWSGRTVYPGPAFFQAITASGITAHYPYIGLPGKAEGSFLELTPDSQRLAWWHSIEESKKPRKSY